MLIRKAFRFRLDPTPEQDDLFRRTVGCTRLVYNLGLEQRRLRYQHQHRKSTPFAYQSAELPALKAEYPWLKDVPAQALQQALKDLNQAFANFFGGTHAYPQPRRKYRNDSFRVPQDFTIDGAHIKLPKFGKVRYIASDRCARVQGTPRSVTVCLEGGRWYGSVLCEVHIADPAPRPDREATAIGIDRGVSVSYAMSTGEMFNTRQYSEGEQKRKRRLARQLSRQKKGSANRRKTREKLARMEARLRERRVDGIHKLTRRLVKNHDLIALEDLRIKNMTRSARGTPEAPGRQVRQKAGLNRAILGQLWGEFRRQLEYKASWYGSLVVRVPAGYTSQTCSACGHLDEASRTSQALFHCTNCGHTANADLNAAMVIHALGVGVYACARAADVDAARQEASVQVPGHTGSVSRGSPAGKARQIPRP
jgi:putative transposase